jgi:protein-S-isoprenylcysteine O-methyltransferase Ste14
MDEATMIAGRGGRGADAGGGGGGGSGLPPPPEVRDPTCGVNCGAWVGWRGSSLENRTAWKAVCSALLCAYTGWYFTMVGDSAALIVIGAVWAAKLLVEIWGQHTPTWACPGTAKLFVAVYVLGLPCFVYLFGGCRGGPNKVDVPHREAVALLLYLFGSGYSLWYEVHRFRWKARPETKGRLHTIGLAQFCIHPNYFGDLFTYTGWGLAAGTRCALSVTPASFWYLILFVVPNSDAYLAERYATEWPAYAARTATLIPFLRNKTAMSALAWLGLVVSIYLQLDCTAACGLS